MIRYEEIVLDNKGGRNRAKACEIGSPRTYILAINVKRRHMSKGQQAMAQAMIYPDPEKGTSAQARRGGEMLGDVGCSSATCKCFSSL